MKKATTYIFEDYRKDKSESMKTKSEKKATAFYNRLIKDGYKVYNFGVERVIIPVERQGERIITYGIY